MNDLPDHLTPETTDRGFDHMAPIEGAYGGTVHVYESSSAESPHIWLNSTKAPIHLTADAAWRLAEQLVTLVREHYHGDAVPEDRRFDVLPVATGQKLDNKPERSTLRNKLASLIRRK